MVTIYYILNRHIDMERVTKEQLSVMIETITSQGGRIVKIVNERGQHIQLRLAEQRRSDDIPRCCHRQHIQLKFNTIPKRW